MPLVDSALQISQITLQSISRLRVRPQMNKVTQIQMSAYQLMPIQDIVARIRRVEINNMILL